MKQIIMGISEYDIAQKHLPGIILEKYPTTFKKLVRSSLNRMRFRGSFKGGITASVLWERAIPGESPVREVRHYPIRGRMLFDTDDSWEETFQEWGEQLDQLIEDTEVEGSGWSFEGVTKLTI